VIAIHISGEQIELRDLDESWVIEEIRRLQRNDTAVCVRVTINEANVHLTLTTPGCPQSRGGGRPPNETEREILDLWRKRHLDSHHFNGGEFIAFLKQLRNVL
jgi:hypothetical protein